MWTAGHLYRLKLYTPFITHCLTLLFLHYLQPKHFWVITWPLQHIIHTWSIFSDHYYQSSESACVCEPTLVFMDWYFLQLLMLNNYIRFVEHNFRSYFFDNLSTLVRRLLTLFCLLRYYFHSLVTNTVLVIVFLWFIKFLISISVKEYIQMLIALLIPLLIPRWGLKQSVAFWYETHGSNSGHDFIWSIYHNHIAHRTGWSYKKSAGKRRIFYHMFFDDFYHIYVWSYNLLSQKRSSKLWSTFKARFSWFWSSYAFYGQAI